jgi:hypothetical protein
LLALIALLVFVVALVGGVAITDLFLVKLGVIMAFIPVMIAYTRKNRPGFFHPHAIPDKVLPGGRSGRPRAKHESLAIGRYPALLWMR